MTANRESVYLRQAEREQAAASRTKPLTHRYRLPITHKDCLPTRPSSGDARSDRMRRRCQNHTKDRAGGGGVEAAPKGTSEATSLAA